MRRTPQVTLFLTIAAFGFFQSGCKLHQPSKSPTTTAGGRVTSKKTGTAFAYVRLPDADEKEKVEVPQGGLAAASPDNFHGTDRRVAKVSISDTSTQTFADLAALLDSGLLIPDRDMISQNTPRTADSDRVPEEQHNVIVTAFLYASAKESDNDFHCIIGAAPGQPQRFLNVEVSGLPVTGQFRVQLKSVRDKFKEFFGQDLPGQGYSKFDPPIPVRINGSLFFDVDHPAGAVGPTGLRPRTAWEIHPVSDIEFEP